MLSLFLLVSLGAYSVQSAPEVIVIGAGASGLAAARVLTDAGRYKVTVLEARPNRYGGRIWTNTENFHNATGPEVDMGASFIRYADEKNSVVQLHREYDLPLFEMDREVSLVVRGNDSMPYTKASVDAASMRVNKAFEAVGDLSSKLITDISVYKALSKLKQSPLIGDPLSQTFVSLQEFNFGAPIEKISTRYLKAGHVNAQAKTSKKIPALGFRKMIDRIVKKSSSDPSLNILLGQEVTEVNVREDKRVVIKCRNGETYKADAVIVTLPLGILKADNVKFSPSLTLKKRRAIRRVGFGTINKLVIKFNQRFWTVNTRQISVAASNIADRGKLTHLLSFHDIANKPVIVAYAVGHFGEESEKMTDNELEKLALSRLRTVFGTALNGANVVDLSRTKWKSDPFAMGSFSFPTVGIKEGDWDVLGEAEPPLFFAGEHTRTKQYGTVQTAIDTGRKAATDVETYLSSADSIPALSAFVNLCFVFLSILLSI